jgi:hypothetical protein
MTQPLPAALRAAAEDLYALEAATGLIIAHGTWLARDDFARFIHQCTGTAAIDWEAAVSALPAGELPSSGGDRRILLLSASLAGQVLSASATRSPASTTATSDCWSRLSYTPLAAASSPASSL